MTKLFIVIAFFFCTGLVKAQQANSISVNLYGAYIFQDKVDLDNFYGYAKEGFQYGGGIEYFFEKTSSIELKYLRQSTHFPLYGPSGSQLNAELDKGSVNYILLGGTGYFAASPKSKVTPYAGLGAGVGILGVKDGNSTTKFAWDGKLGVRINSSSNISFKLQASFQSVIGAVGNDFYYAGGGTVIAVPDNATLFQFGLGGGLCFGL